MLTPAPRPPSAYADAAWLRRGRELLRPGKLWTVAGFPGYTVNEAGEVWREAYTDRGGRRRDRHLVQGRWFAGGLQYRLFKASGFATGISQRKLRGRLVRAA